MPSWLFNHPGFRHLFAYKYCQVNPDTSQQGFQQLGVSGLVPANKQRHAAGWREIVPEEFRQIEKVRRVETTLQGRDIREDSLAS